VLAVSNWCPNWIVWKAWYSCPSLAAAIEADCALKVTDLDREVAFLREVGASLVLRERVSMVGEEREYAILMLGGVHMLLFETVVFENFVSGGVRPGLTHAVYEVDELDAEYARIRALGAEVLVEPTEVSAGFGKRRLAFFRSPSGFVFEVMQVLERKI
jgi:catechol 2,3-dioxygenase-like lactoylglutathione lyase family enzyme